MIKIFSITLEIIFWVWYSILIFHISINKKQKFLVLQEILRNKTMNDKLIYIPNENTHSKD